MATDEATHASTRSELHRVATHILARRRFAVGGRFGLRASPGGLATPVFGTEPETLRIAGDQLIREVGSASTSTPLVGSSLRDLARLVGVDLQTPFDCGPDAPPPGDIDQPIALDLDAVSVMADWYDLGWRVLDTVIASLPAEAMPATIQLWPEHFDAGTTVRVSSGATVNLGCSPGDGFEVGPYVYVGPQKLPPLPSSDFWNAPFGAVLRRSDLSRQTGPAEQCIEFLQAGIALAGSS